jgi:catechol 2,3-dioxygenase-like lactoylglutathione lyase family enzyme
MGIVGHYHHVHLISADPRATAEWYVEFLGGEIFRDEELRGARNVRVMLGECMLNVRGVRETDNIEPSATGKQRLGIDHFCFQVDDIDALLEAFTAKGGEISTPLFELPSGNRAAFVTGPDGVDMELIQVKA